MHSKITFFSLMVFTSFSLQALQLKPIPAGQNTTLSGSEDPIACDQIVNAMADLQGKMSAHETSLTAFLGQVSQGLRNWHAQLSPLENKAEIIPAGTFLVLQDAADKTDAITNVAFDNTDYVTSQMARIVSAARGCNISAPTK